MTPPALRMGSAQARWVLTFTALGGGLVFLDTTVVNVALRNIGTEVGAIRNMGLSAR